MEVHPKKLYINAQQAADYLEVPYPRVIRMIARGEIIGTVEKAANARKNKWRVDFDSCTQWKNQLA